MKTLRHISILCLVVLIPALAPARTWYVKPDSTGDAPTIGTALDSSAYGDTVLVAPGTYYSDSTGTEDDAWIRMKDGVALVSEDGPEVTTLIKCPASAGGIDYVVSLDRTWETTLRGFTIRMWEFGECEPGGGVQFTAASCDEAHAVIEDNVITGGFVDGIRVRGPFPMSSSPIIKNNSITYCVDRAIDCANTSPYSSPWIEGNKMAYNGIGLYMENTYPVVERNVISYNYDGLQIRCPAVVNFRMNVITHNSNCGAWIWERIGYPYTAPCFNCSWEEETANDIYGNGAYDIYFRDDTGNDLIEARYNYWGTLCPSASQFYGRVSWIPWVDSTHTVLCSDCESCHHATEPTTWGSIKAMYR